MSNDKMRIAFCFAGVADMAKKCNRDVLERAQRHSWEEAALLPSSSYALPAMTETVHRLPQM